MLAVEDEGAAAAQRSPPKATVLLLLVGSVILGTADPPLPRLLPHYPRRAEKNAVQ